jgi:xanthine/uracil permease
MARRIIGIHEKLSVLESLPLSFQHLTAMFGATILVPILLGINPAIALLMNGIGTLLYSWITKEGIPAYLGSSFAFIAPALLIISTYGGFNHAQSGFIFFGLFFIIISFVVKQWGIRWIDVVMPPAVMGAVVAIIGLELAPVCSTTSRTCSMANSSRENRRSLYCKYRCADCFDVYTVCRHSWLCDVQGFYAGYPNLICCSCRLFAWPCHGNG